MLLLTTVALSRAAVPTLSESTCTLAKLGSAIPVSGIREPVSAVTLAAPIWKAASATVPAHCSVDGAMAPIDPGAKPIHFRVLLPAAWSGRAAQFGGGGNNGTIPDLMDTSRFTTGPSALQRGFATYGSDSGHKTTDSAEWALNDETVKNLAYMQLRKTHDAAMALMRLAYGRRPRFNYYLGNSQGGREGLTIAQRYPADYDGVIANVPVLNFSSLMLAPEWIRIAEKPLAGWVTPAKTNAIRAEFMRQCDSLEGLAHGVINNYMACRARFNATSAEAWSEKRCPGNSDPNPSDTTANACLTDGEIATLQMVYSPYRFSEPLANGVATFGMWIPNTDPAGFGLIAPVRFRGQEGAAENAPLHTHLGVIGVTGYLMRDLKANPLDYVEGGKWSARRQELSAWFDATNPDLSAFRKRGGRMIVTIGANDTLASPGAQLDYYQSLLDTMGRAALDSFARLFVIPQAGHGLTGVKMFSGEPVPASYDKLGYLLDWVEKKIAPAKNLTVSAGTSSLPLCSWPEYPRYVDGPPSAASSYQCAE